MANEIMATANGLVRKAPRHRYVRRSLFEGNGRRLLWDGLGKDVSAANSAREVCKLADLDFEVKTEPIFTHDGVEIKNMVATRRYDEYNGELLGGTVYGVVSNRYQPVQNHEGFEFIDALFGQEGFEIETAGHFDDGKIVWLEAKLPERVMSGENIMPYLVFTNRHDGRGSVRIFLSPVRIICKNTLNYAIKKAQNRNFSVRHTTNAVEMLQEATKILQNYNAYLDAMNKIIENQKRVLLSDGHFDQLISRVFPIKESDKDSVKERIKLNRDEVRAIYNSADDLSGREKSGFRFVNAVSDWATHHTPMRETKTYKSKLFQDTINGNPYIDSAVEIIDEWDGGNKMLIA